MASAGLAQIDENSSLTHLGDSSPLVLPSPACRSGIPSSPFGFTGEKTPEFWPKRASLGEATPEAWPKTPTPRCFIRGNFNLGDETPESWPEVHPSFFFCPQQPDVNAQLAALVPVGTQQQQPFVPQQPFVFVPVDMNQVGQTAASTYTAAPENVAANGFRSEVLASRLLGAARAEQFAVADQKSTVSSQTFKSTKGSKPTKSGKPDPDAEDACPVAVYVDLSGLKDMRPSLGRFGTARL
jgi:hypothetical protein